MYQFTGTYKTAKGAVGRLTAEGFSEGIARSTVQAAEEDGACGLDNTTMLENAGIVTGAVVEYDEPGIFTVTVETGFLTACGRLT